MAIISESKSKVPVQFKSAQFRYAIIYVLVTFFVLLFLNIYCSKISQQLFYSSKKESMLEICHILSNEISKLDVLNKNAVGETVENMTSMVQTRIIVTDNYCRTVYDSADKTFVRDNYILFPEVILALEVNDVFSWSYRDGAMQSYAACPIIAYGSLIGCVYITEFDTTQGALIASIQNNILIITLVLEIVVIVFSFFSSGTYARRLRKILTSIRIVRDGDYSHKVKLRGNDELNVLSNDFNDLINRLQVSENKRTQFVSDASHELKTPLASIKLLSDSILQNEMDEATVKEFVSDIGNEAERLNKMSQKLLALSRTDSQVDTDREVVFVKSTVERVIRMLSATAANNHITTHLDIKEDFTILIAEDDLYQVIFNLIENGIKYNRLNGHLYISLCKQNNKAVIRIEDTGSGIPKESLSHIFDRFYRVDKARSRSTGGSGLGLSIVRNIVKRNNGKIEVESVLGKGTVFTLYFPIYTSEEVIQ